MNTTGIQNYLSNVFVPIYAYDTTNSNFTPKLELSNIDVYSGNSVNVFTAAIGDANNNVYVGRGAGNAYNFLQACSNVTALGFAAAGGISNDSNSVYLGYFAGYQSSNAKDIISIGASSGRNGGVSNIFIGTNTGTTGSSNVLIGHGIDLSSVSNQVRIGYKTQIPIAADVSRNWVGLGGILSPTDINYGNIDVSGNTRIQGALALNTVPGGRTLDVNGNFRAQDGANTMDFSNGILTTTGGYSSVYGDVSGIVGTTTIGTIKRGIIHVSTVDKASSANRAAYIYFAWTTSNVTSLGATSNGDTNITTSTTNIQISNATTAKNYAYSITYFPLP